MTSCTVSDLARHRIRLPETYSLLNISAAHGMRTIDVLRKWCKIEDPKLLESEVIRFESAILAAAEAAAASSGNGIEVLPGVRKLLDDLSSEKDKRAGEEKWAICTSSTYFYAGKAIPIAGLTTPKIFVTAESVTKGKPAPDRKFHFKRIEQ